MNRVLIEIFVIRKGFWKLVQSDFFGEKSKIKINTDISSDMYYSVIKVNIILSLKKFSESKFVKSDSVYAFAAS